MYGLVVESIFQIEEGEWQRNIFHFLITPSSTPSCLPALKDKQMILSSLRQWSGGLKKPKPTSSLLLCLVWSELKIPGLLSLCLTWARKAWGWLFQTRRTWGLRSPSLQTLAARLGPLQHWTVASCARLGGHHQCGLYFYSSLRQKRLSFGGRRKIFQ